MLHTRLCDVFGIEHPILNAPMGGGTSTAALAASVSEAGGLGMIGGTSIGGASWLRDEIKRAHDLTARPFGVGFISHLRGAAQLMDVAIEEGVRVIAHSFADPAPFMSAARAAEVTVLCQVRTVADALPGRRLRRRRHRRPGHRSRWPHRRRVRNAAPRSGGRRRRSTDSRDRCRRYRRWPWNCGRVDPRSGRRLDGNPLHRESRGGNF